MANRNSQGFGLKAAMRAGNTPSIQGQSKYDIDAGESNAIFNGEPVVVDLNTSTGGYIVTAAAGTTMVGVLNGVLFTDATTYCCCGLSNTNASISSEFAGVTCT